MLTAQRKNLLLARLASEGRLVAATLAMELGVSEDTIRRDLRELAADLLDTLRAAPGGCCGFMAGRCHSRRPTARLPTGAAWRPRKNGASPRPRQD